jgi:hypothetical protein
MSSVRRTDFADFVLDLLDFMEEKIREALDDEGSRPAAIGEAAGAVPLLRDRLREDEVAQAQFMLVFGVQLFEPHATPWWAEFARMERAEFEQRAADLVGPQGRLAALRTVVGTNDPAGC